MEESLPDPATGARWLKWYLEAKAGDQEVMGKLLETADFLQRSAAHCDGRSHTWFRETQCQAGHHAGKKLIVDRIDSQTWPEPRG